MAIDPIRGMTVDKTSALSAEPDGRTVYFCSDDCRQKFLAEPAEAMPEESANDDHDSLSPRA
jgi:Cu+-exporting ATPase